MDGIAASLVIKIVIMMIFVIALFFIVLLVFKHKFVSGINKQYFKVLDTVFINNKDRILDFQYKDCAYLLYVNQNNCVLLDKREGLSTEGFDLESKEENSFKYILEKVYKR